jgi:hypothetical protein
MNKFHTAETHFMLSCAASRAHIDLAKSAFRLYGDHGAQVSGCVRDHFPEAVKETLRQLARQCREHSEAAHAARPKFARKAFMVRVGQNVAARDGAGFYGPQPRDSGAAGR